MFSGRTVYFLAVAALLQEVSGHAADLCSSNIKLIISGHNIPIKDAPYMAALQRQRVKRAWPFGSYLKFFCGATIIHERFLLTAAHCYLTEKIKHPIYASIGSERYKNTSTNILMEVDKFLCHEHYDPLTIKNDICLVKLKKPVPFGKNITKIELAGKNFNVKPRTMVKITGWGQYKVDVLRSVPLDLQRTSIPILSQKCCHELDRTIDNTMICAGIKGRGSCYGDSGGPLVYNNVQIGVVSRLADNTTGCAQGMDVYTRVNRFLDWIQTTIANNL